MFGKVTSASATPASGRAAQSPVWNCVRCALLAMLAVLVWQFLTVRFNYRGNWTALFCTGGSAPLPPELASGTYRFQGSAGYDGQYYRLMAHDPWGVKGYWRYMDIRRMRYRRILLPGAAWLLAGGDARFIDAAYIAAVLLCVGLGSYWLARYAVHHGRHPLWGCGFVLAPATVISIDRLTVDVALATCTMAFAWYDKRDAPGRLYLSLALAVLARETGALLVAAACLYALWQRRWVRAAVLATALAPALLWFHVLTTGIPLALLPGVPLPGFFPHWLLRYPLVGIVMKMCQPADYPLGAAALLAARALDVLALAGVLLAVGLTVGRLWRRQIDAESLGALAFVGLTLLVSAPGFWRDINGWARPITPLLMLVGLPAVARRSPLWLVPILLADLRLAPQFRSQVLGILQGLFS